MAATTSQVEAGSGAQLSSQEYQQLVGRIRSAARAILPPDATVLVVSKGDNELLKLDGRDAWHFPREADGRYAGHYPADDQAAIAHLEDLRSWGAEYLLFPHTAFWWLEHYTEFKRHLETRHRLVFHQNDCAIFALSNDNGESADILGMESKVLAGSIGDLVKRLLPNGARIAVAIPPDNGQNLLPGNEVWRLPEQDHERARADLEALQAGGVEFLVVPRPTFDWLERYPALRRYLTGEHRLVTHQENLCVIYELRPQSARSERPITQDEPVAAGTSRPRGIQRLLSLLSPRGS